MPHWIFLKEVMRNKFFFLSGLIYAFIGDLMPIGPYCNTLFIFICKLNIKLEMTI